MALFLLNKSTSWHEINTEPKKKRWYTYIWNNMIYSIIYYEYLIIINTAVVSFANKGRDVRWLYCCNCNQLLSQNREPNRDAIRSDMEQLLISGCHYLWPTRMYVVGSSAWIYYLKPLCLSGNASTVWCSFYTLNDSYISGQSDIYLAPLPGINSQVAMRLPTY